jgi:Excinuclease ATPase subunit
MAVGVVQGEHARAGDPDRVELAEELRQLQDMAVLVDPEVRVDIEDLGPLGDQGPHLVRKLRELGSHRTRLPARPEYTGWVAQPSSGVIRVIGAREHNLKDVSLDIPRESLVVITGLSGSGKSSLAFDTLYAEGQRRYVESLSAYARQFLGQMDKPDVDTIEGLSPAISIDQKTTSRNPRSTVATVTEIYDYLRLLFARVGEPHCPVCGRPIAGQSVEQIADRVLELEDGTRFQVLAPLVRGRKGEHRDVIAHIAAEGFARVRSTARPTSSTRRRPSTGSATTRSRWSSTGSS